MTRFDSSRMMCECSGEAKRERQHARGRQHGPVRRRVEALAPDRRAMDLAAVEVHHDVDVLLAGERVVLEAPLGRWPRCSATGAGVASPRILHLAGRVRGAQRSSACRQRRGAPSRRSSGLVRIRFGSRSRNARRLAPHRGRPSRRRSGAAAPGRSSATRSYSCLAVELAACVGRRRSGRSPPRARRSQASSPSRARVTSAPSSPSTRANSSSTTGSSSATRMRRPRSGFGSVAASGASTLVASATVAGTRPRSAGARGSARRSSPARAELDPPAVLARRCRRRPTGRARCPARSPSW